MSRAPIESRPTIAQWLITEREAAGFTNALDFLKAVKAAEGSAPSYSTYAQWESGSVTPRSSTLRAIRHFHETRKGGQGQPKPTATAPDLATALSALAASNEALAVELRWLREEREAQARAIVALAERIAALEAPASGARSAPLATAG